MIGNPACEYAICVVFCLKFSIKSDPKMCQTRSGLLQKSDAFLPTFGRMVNGRLILELQRNVTFTQELGDCTRVMECYCHYRFVMVVMHVIALMKVCMTFWYMVRIAKCYQLSTTFLITNLKQYC